MGISWIWGEKKPQEKAVLCFISEEAKCLFRGVIRSSSHKHLRSHLEFQWTSLALFHESQQTGHFSLLFHCFCHYILSCCWNIFPEPLWNIEYRVLQKKARGGFCSNIYSSLSFLLFQELISFIDVYIIDFTDYSLIF